MIRPFGWNEFLIIVMAAQWTIALSAIAFAGGGIGGLLVALARVSDIRPLRILAVGFIRVFQGTPLLMQLFLVFFGMNIFGLAINPWVAASIALTLHASAFLGEIWRGCVEAVPPGQREAATALGLKYVNRMRYIILPQLRWPILFVTCYQTLSLLASFDYILLATDGVYEHIGAREVAQLVAEDGNDLDLAARRIVERALANGSDDNLTAQLVRIDSLPEQAVDDVQRQLGELALPPLLEPRMQFDGYRIVRELHVSSRSHVHLAVDEASGATVVLKTPSMDLRGDAAYLERFLVEEWIARRLDNPHVVKACPPPRQRRYLYTVSEFIDGQTLAQWMLDHPQPDLETVRGIVEQIARGLRAFHRLEMLHQDLRPQNLMIDATGTLKLIDFGSTRVAGLAERNAPGTQDNLLGTAAYTAPEYFLGEAGTPRSDQYSLAVIAYQLLSGRLPYGADVARARTTAAQKRLCYQPLRHAQRDIPAWIDEVLGKALHPDPSRRYAELSEFVFELRQPNPAFLNRARPPLLERNPLLFWKGLSLLLAVTVVVLLLR